MKTASFRDRARDDLRAIFPSLLHPFRDLHRGGLRDKRTLIAVAVVGLAPLVLLDVFGSELGARGIFTALALYVSAIWAVFFATVFPTPEIRIGRALFAFFGTAVVGIGLLLTLYGIPPFSWLILLTKAPFDPFRLLGYIGGVGLPEEATKALVLLLFIRMYGAASPKLMLFYGLMSGLGFGIREGIEYQTGTNVAAAGNDVATYYLLNVLRLTSLPFLHAVWGGIDGYFLGYASGHPNRRIGFTIVAIGLPALLHALYDFTAGTILAPLVAAFSVLVLIVYLGNSLVLAETGSSSGENAEARPGAAEPAADGPSVHRGFAPSTSDRRIPYVD